MKKYSLILISLLLILLVGPNFGPIPRYLLSVVSLNSAVALLLLSFLISLGIIFLIVQNFLKQDNKTLHDIGWRLPTTKKAIFFGAFLGVFWAVFSIMGYLQLNPGTNPFEISLFRVGIALFAAFVAIFEDIIVRGYVMNKLSDLGRSRFLQVLFSGLLFAVYHSIWNFSIPGFIASLVYGFLLSGLFILGKRSLTPVILGHSLALLIAEPFLTKLLLRTLQ